MRNKQAVPGDPRGGAAMLMWPPNGGAGAEMPACWPSARRCLQAALQRLRSATFAITMGQHAALATLAGLLLLDGATAQASACSGAGVQLTGGGAFNLGGADYVDQLNCVWTLTCDAGTFPAVTFTTFDTESG